MTAVATISKKEKGAELTALITGDWATQISGTAYRGFTPDRMAAELIQAATKDPTLLECTPASLFLAVTKIARWGLGIGDGAYLVAIPSKVKGRNGQPDAWIKVADAWPDYRGLKALAMRQNLVRLMTEYVVFEGDQFDYELGMNPWLKHKPGPEPEKGSDTRAIVGAYSVIQLPFGKQMFHWMPFRAIEEIRAKSKSWGPDKAVRLPPWYAKKTVARDWINRQPKSGALADALKSDDTEQTYIDGETGEILTGPTMSAQIAASTAPTDDDLDRLAALESGDIDERD